MLAPRQCVIVIRIVHQVPRSPGSECIRQIMQVTQRYCPTGRKLDGIDAVILILIACTQSTRCSFSLQIRLCRFHMREKTLPDWKTWNYLGKRAVL